MRCFICEVEIQKPEYDQFGSVQPCPDCQDIITDTVIGNRRDELNELDDLFDDEDLQFLDHSEEEEDTELEEI